MFLYFMNEKFYKNAKVEQLTKMFLSREEENDLIVKDPLLILWCVLTSLVSVNVLLFMSVKLLRASIYMLLACRQ